MEDGNLANLITGGLSFALMSADSSAKAALKPMNIVSRELRKRNPDLELVERASMYGGNELDHAGEALARAREELEESQKAAVQEKKAEMEASLRNGKQRRKRSGSRLRETICGSAEMAPQITLPPAGMTRTGRKSVKRRRGRFRREYGWDLPRQRILERRLRRGRKERRLNWD